jgi:hypothetical protein
MPTRKRSSTKKRYFELREEKKSEQGTGTGTDIAFEE